MFSVFALALQYPAVDSPLTTFVLRLPALDASLHPFALPRPVPALQSPAPTRLALFSSCLTSSSYLLASPLRSNLLNRARAYRLVRGRRKHQDDALSKDVIVGGPRTRRCRESDRGVQRPECFSTTLPRYNWTSNAVSLRFANRRDYYKHV